MRNIRVPNCLSSLANYSHLLGRNWPVIAILWFFFSTHSTSQLAEGFFWGGGRRNGVVVAFTDKKTVCGGGHWLISNQLSPRGGVRGKCRWNTYFAFLFFFFYPPRCLRGHFVYQSWIRNKSETSPTALVCVVYNNRWWLRPSDSGGYVWQQHLFSLLFMLSKHWQHPIFQKGSQLLAPCQFSLGNRFFEDWITKWELQ